MATFGNNTYVWIHKCKSTNLIYICNAQSISIYLPIFPSITLSSSSLAYIVYTTTLEVFCLLILTGPDCQLDMNRGALWRSRGPRTPGVAAEALLAPKLGARDVTGTWLCDRMRMARAIARRLPLSSRFIQ